VLWVAGFLMFGSLNRGGLVSMLAALGLVVFVRFRSNWVKLAVATTVGAALFVALGWEVDLGTSRSVSPRQILPNLGSVSGGGATGEGTRRWRLLWWQTIIDYTVRGEHFWSGKGFGVNLADEDGFQTDRNHTLRSAHNGHLTILARAGVPGFAVWVLLQGGVWLGLLRACYRARRQRHHQRAALVLWVLAYLSAALVNSTFDVYLEGPQGGIWFWVLVGAGIALAAGRAGEREAGTTRPVPIWSDLWRMQRC
jgi:O-antigen ligase